LTRGRNPSATLVVDTNIIVGAILSARRRPIWALANARRRLLISIEGVAEVMSVISYVRDRLPYALEDAAALLELLDAPSADRYKHLLVDAADALRNAVASRNGSASDAHVLALAWTYDADIWSHDRDFAGTGWPSWSSANLAAALADEAEAEAQPV
jgi:predicted nucleic acid-binding protein